MTALPPGSTPSTAADTIHGNGGGDTLDGGAGPDAIYGGDVKDYIEDNSIYNAFSPNVANSGNAIHGGGGDDEITIYMPVFLPGANPAANVAYGDDGDDYIELWASSRGATGSTPMRGVTSLFGGQGNDFLFGYRGADAATDNISGASVKLYGEEGDDLLRASYRLDMGMFGTGNGDALRGGAGDDLYVIYEAKDRVVEAADQGVDEVVTYNMDYTLPTNVENLFVMYPAYNDGVLEGRASTGNGLPNVIYGSELGETLNGVGGNDTMYGDAGIDRLGGGTGTDTLHGGADPDTLIGRDGADHLYGDAGNDVFDYDYVADTKPGASLRDLIYDFAGIGPAAGDRIDLATIDANTGAGGNQAFGFKGTAAFTAPGQVRVQAISGSTDTLIQANVTGAAGAELEIQVKDGAMLPDQWAGGDFIL